MSENALSFTEKIESPIEAQGVQITVGLKSFLLTNKGKKSNALLEEFTEEEQAEIKEVYGFISAKLIKKADATSTVTASEIVKQVEGNIEATPEPEVEE